MRPSSTVVVGGVVALLALTSPLHAQDAPPPSPAPKPKAAPAAISDQAREHFNAGVRLLQDPEGEKVEEAYREFRTAFDLSGSAKILGNMGYCAMRLERDGEAIDAYSRYVREVPDIDADERAQIVRDLQTLQVGVVRLTIEVNKPGVSILDERIPVRGPRVTNAYGPVDKKIEIGVRPGHHIITAKLADHDDATWELDAYAGSKDKFSFTLTEPPPPAAVPAAAPPPRPGPNVGPWITIGTGGALLIAGTITGVIALGKTSDIASKCPNDTCPRSFDLDGERSTARTFVRITDVLLLTGGLVTAGGLTWLFLDRKGDTKTGLAKSGLAGTNVGCGPDGCRASWKVAF